MVANRVGPPVRGADCYGREALVELLWQKLAGGHVLLAAPCRFGKTSVMYRLIDEPRPGYRVVHADLQHLEEPAQLITQLVAQLASDSHLSKIAEGLSYFPRRLWSRFRKNFEEVELFKLKVRLREELRARWQESGEELFRRVGVSTATIVFVLDELAMMLDRMRRSSGQRRQAKTMLSWLRAPRVSPTSGNVRFLVAGSIGMDHVLAGLGESKSMNDFERIRLEPFSPGVAGDFIEELCRTEQLELSQASRRRLLELLGTLVPYFIQILFSELMKVERQEGKRLLRELAVVGELSRDACFQLYREGRAGAPEVEEFNRVMTALENDFYIRFEPRDERYEFACKLLRDWWLRHYALEVGG